MIINNNVHLYLLHDFILLYIPIKFILMIQIVQAIYLCTCGIKLIFLTPKIK